MTVEEYAEKIRKKEITKEEQMAHLFAFQEKPSEVNKQKTFYRHYEEEAKEIKSVNLHSIR